MATCVESVTEMKVMFQIKRHAWFQHSLKFSAHMNMFQDHHLENRKSSFLVFILKPVYGAILETSKSNDLQNCQTYFEWILGISWHDFYETARKRRRTEAKTSKDGSHLLLLARQL